VFANVQFQVSTITASATAAPETRRRPTTSMRPLVRFVNCPPSKRTAPRTRRCGPSGAHSRFVERAGSWLAPPEASPQHQRPDLWANRMPRTGFQRFFLGMPRKCLAGHGLAALESGGAGMPQCGAMLRKRNVFGGSIRRAAAEPPQIKGIPLSLVISEGRVYLRQHRSATSTSTRMMGSRGDWPKFERRPAAVRPFVTAFLGLSQPYLLTAARLAREPSTAAACG
jgi:hypothetical protein